MTDDLFIEEEIMDEMSEYLENYRNKDTDCKSTVMEDTETNDSIDDEFEKIISDYELGGKGKVQEVIRGE